MPRPQWSFLMLPEDHKEVKWLISFARAKFTVWGQIIFGMFLVGLAISSVGTQIAAYYFVSFVWALFVSSLFLTTFFRPVVEAKRLLPSTVTAGGVCLYRVVVTNTGKTPLRNLEIFEHKLPFGLYSQLQHPRHKTSVFWLAPGKSAVLTLALRTPRRGAFVLQPLIAGTSFPTGLIRSLGKVSGESSFVVFPKPIKSVDLNIVLKNKFQPGVLRSVSRLGHSNEFLSTRDYRQGDRLRDVHWNSSARLGKFIVKEYTQEHFVRVGLFLDTQLGRFEKHLCFEALISLCAAIAEDLLNKNYLVDLFVADRRWPAVESAGPPDRLRHFLEILSAVEGQEKVDFSYVRAQIAQHAQEMSGLVLFFKEWSEERAAFVESIKQMNVPVQVVLVSDKLFLAPVNDLGVTVYTPKQLEYTL